MSKSILQWAAMPMFLCLYTTAQAVHLGESGQGDALILPYWTTQGGNDTLLTLRNSHDAPVAIKVRVLGADGVELHAFNLYLDARVTWAAGFAHFDDAPRLFSRDPSSSCTLPILAQEAPFGTPQFELSAGHGYLEIIEMGVAEPGVVTDDRGDWQSCFDLEQRLQSGAWLDTPNAGMLPPAGRIGATAQIIDVADGGMTTFDAVALAGFSDVAQHSGPDILVPNLASAHDAGTPGGATTSQVCLPEGCRTDEWAHPVEAVAAVLTVASLEADFNIRSAIGAQAELVIVRPLQRYEDALDGDFRVDAEPTLTFFDRSGRMAADECTGGPAPPTRPPPPPLRFVLPRDSVVDVVSFNDPADDANSGPWITPILGASIETRFSLEVSEVTAGFGLVAFENHPGDKLVSGNGDAFIGEAALGIAIQQFSNGAVMVDGDAVLSNYRGAQQPARRRVVLPEE